VPHNNIFNTYYFKAKDGMRHATMFTLRLEPQVIFIHEAGQNVVQNNCVRCHDPLINNTKLATMMPERHLEIHDRNVGSAIAKHRTVGLTASAACLTPECHFPQVLFQHG
jgi:hypothetical protein